MNHLSALSTHCSTMPSLESRQVAVIVSFAILNALALIAVGLRFYARAFIRRETQAHDILTIVSLVMLIGYTTCLLVATVKGGVGIPLTQAIASGLSIMSVLKVNMLLSKTTRAMWLTNTPHVDFLCLPAILGNWNSLLPSCNP